MPTFEEVQELNAALLNRIKSASKMPDFGYSIKSKFHRLDRVLNSYFHPDVKTLFCRDKEDETKVMIPNCPDDYESDNNWRKFSFTKFVRQLNKLQEDPDWRQEDIAPFIFDPDEIQTMAQVWGQIREDSYFEEILSGKAIYYPYAKIKSCMSCKEDWLQFYADNPDVVRLLVIYKDEGDESTLVGRALLWTTTGGETVLDRVYPCDDGAHTLWARKIARQNGWYYRQNDHAECTIIEPGEEKFVVQLDWHGKGFPFIDTFRYGYSNGNKIILQNFRDENCVTECAQSTTGGWHGVLESCRECSEKYLKDNSDLVYEGIKFCPDCYEDAFVYSEILDKEIFKDKVREVTIDGNVEIVSQSTPLEIKVDENGTKTFHLIEDIDKIEDKYHHNLSLGGWIYRENLVKLCNSFYYYYSQWSGSKHSHRNLTVQDTDDRTILKSDAIKIDGECYHHNDPRITFDGEKYLIKNIEDSLEDIANEFTVQIRNKNTRRCRIQIRKPSGDWKESDPLNHYINSQAIEEYMSSGFQTFDSFVDTGTQYARLHPVLNEEGEIWWCLMESNQRVISHNQIVQLANQ